jgi:hypothetical protein
MDVETIEEEDEMGVNAAVARATEYAMTRGATSVIVLPSDIPLLTSEDLDRIILMAAEAPSMVITPSLRFDGTNALLLSPPNAMATCYEGDSYNAHLEKAEEMGLAVPADEDLLRRAFRLTGERMLDDAWIEYYRDDNPDPLLEKLFERAKYGFVDYTVIRLEGPARNFTSDLTFYRTYLWGFDFADALTALQEWSVVYPLGFVVFLALSYASAGLTGLVFRRRWHPAALLGFANALTLIGVAVCARYFLDGRAARLFWLVFTVIFVALTVVVQNILTACLWNL